MGIFDIFKKRIRCPSCGSKKVGLEEKGFHFKPHMLITCVVGVAAEAIKSKETHYACQKCGKVWDWD
jgi:DNA-directed RNA polymerase subunit RPC12/RpoP